jgi:hypothetical protein
MIIDLISNKWALLRLFYVPPDSTKGNRSVAVFNKWAFETFSDFDLLPDGSFLPVVSVIYTFPTVPDPVLQLKRLITLLNHSGYTAHPFENVQVYLYDSAPDFTKIAYVAPRGDRILPPGRLTTVPSSLPGSIELIDREIIAEYKNENKAPTPYTEKIIRKREQHRERNRRHDTFLRATGNTRRERARKAKSETEQ